ncbi:MAG: glycosyltransferase [Planctomycetes bacterium]|nr:glycosyltransferase [Planctomycetota bacterium]
MRVALVSHNAKSGDAIGNQVAEKLAFFLERGAEVRVLIESAERLHPDVSRHHEVVQAAATGAAWVFLATADLVSFEFGQFYSLLTLLPLLEKPRIIVDYHGITPLEMWSGHNREAVLRGLQHRGLVHHADRVLVHSRYIERELLEATGIPRDRICRIGLPVDPARLEVPANLARRRDRVRRNLGLMDEHLLLYVGRLAPNKRVPMLVDALAKLRERRPAVHLLIVGDTGDLYRAEADACWQRAAELGVSTRVHFLGHLGDDELVDLYRTADAFVTASRWEGFCVPVIEAMAVGLPVIAARAAALPETIGAAGLTFTPDDADELAEKIASILPRDEHRKGIGSRPAGSASPSLAQVSSRRIAIVACRYGADIVGGAEWSLRRIAQTLQAAGHAVEVFTTCNRDESHWHNELPAGVCDDAGIAVRRFPIEDHDRPRHLASVEAMMRCHGDGDSHAEQSYLSHSLHSTALIDELHRRRDEFAAIIVGPYLFGLTADVADRFPDKTLLLPCFHDEPLARLAVWKRLYAKVAGVLYHSPEEQDLAQADLGINHPNANVIGTWIAIPELQEARDDPAAPPGRYVVYCGRYSPQKDVPRLLEFAQRYHGDNPGRFTFVFMGGGAVPIPREPWALDLGFVSEARKAKVLRGADALVMLSPNESLSLVALEAWAQETPVIVSSACAVLAGHLKRSEAGVSIDDYPAFAAALDDLWERPAAWQKRGQRGRQYVSEHHGSAAAFRAKLERSLIGTEQPLAQCLGQRGLERAAQFTRPGWQMLLADAVDQALHAEPCRQEASLELQPTRTHHDSAPGREMLCSVRLTNHGAQPAWAEGPGRTMLRGQVRQDGRAIGPVAESPLPGLLLPGRDDTAVIAVAVPVVPGPYQIAFWTARAGEDTEPVFVVQTELRVGVSGPEQSLCGPVLERVQALLARVERSQRLPDDYLDVTEGRFASLKRWLKRKVLNNFKIAYVDVLSRQQSQVNRELLAAVQELAECCTTLDHAVRLLTERAANRERVRPEKPAAIPDAPASSKAPASVE